LLVQSFDSLTLTVGGNARQTVPKATSCRTESCKKQLNRPLYYRLL